MPRRKNVVGTRNHILEVAIPEFGRKGYRDTTITEICRQAGTNIGSVNYHFGDKETLYVEVWKEAFRRSLEKHPPDGGVGQDAPAEERLRGRIIAMLRRITDPSSFDFEIVQMEMANPTGFLTEPIKAQIEPQANELASIFRELLGDKACEESVELCLMSIHSQCMNPNIFGKRHAAMQHDSKFPHPPEIKADVETIADHVVRFSLGGLKEVRRYMEDGKGK